MSTTTKPAAKAAPRVIIADMRKGDVFSESSHYIYQGPDTKRGYEFTHLESGNPVFLTQEYVTELLSTADQWHGAEILVGREDKLWTEKQLTEAHAKGEFLNARVGDIRVKGIRTLFEEIHSAEVFGLCFLKQPEKYTKKDRDAAIQKQIEDATALIEKAQKNSKSMKTAYASALKMVQDNPITEYKAPEERKLRGYKVQFNSRDGRYDCVDMDKPKNDNIRPVNINTLQWLVVRGVKYVVEK
jgi:hypothetical protein